MITRRAGAPRPMPCDDRATVPVAGSATPLGPRPCGRIVHADPQRMSGAMASLGRAIGVAAGPALRRGRRA